MHKNHNKIENHTLWKKRIADFRASGLSASEFSRQNNYSVFQVHYWKTKFLPDEVKITSPVKTQPSPLIKVIQASTPKKQTIDPKWVAQLIKELYEIS
jgi:hypothetical protein